MRILIGASLAICFIFLLGVPANAASLPEGNVTAIPSGAGGDFKSVRIGNGAGGNGKLTLDGSTAPATFFLRDTVGDGATALGVVSTRNLGDPANTGTFDILNGAVLDWTAGGPAFISQAELARLPGTNAFMTVDGAGSALAMNSLATSQGFIRIGRVGQATANVRNGGSVGLSGDGVGLTIGRGDNGVLDPGDPAYGDEGLYDTPPFPAPGAPVIEKAPESVVNVTGGGTITFTNTGPAESSLTLGTRKNGNGHLRVSDAGSAVNVSGADVNVGVEGTGQVEVENDASMTVTGGNTLVATKQTAVGSVAVTGAGSVFDGGNLLLVGQDFDAVAGTPVADQDANPGGMGTIVLGGGGMVRAVNTQLGRGGSLTGNGTLQSTLTVAGGTVGPGASPGELTIDGNAFFNDALLEIEVEGLLPGLFDVVNVTGEASFTDGIIRFIFDGYTPQAGDMLTFLTAGDLIAFDNVTVETLGTTLPVDVLANLGAGGSFEFVVTPIPAALPLLGTAVALLGMVGWRRRKTATGG